MGDASLSPRQTNQTSTQKGHTLRRHILSALAVLALLFVGTAPAAADEERTWGHTVPEYNHEYTPGECSAEIWAQLKKPSKKEWLLVALIDGTETAVPFKYKSPAEMEITSDLLGGIGSGIHNIKYWTENNYGGKTEKVEFSIDCGNPAEPVEPTAVQAVCDETTWVVTSGTITIPEAENVYYTIDGEKFDAGTYKYDAGTYTVKAYDSRTDAELNSWDLTIDPSPECEAPIAVDPTRPSVSDQTCDTPGFINLWLNEGVDYYLIDGEQHEPGTFVILEPGTYHVEAVLLDGYVLAEGAQGAWDRTIDAAENCDPPVEIERPAAPEIVQPICDEGDVIPGSMTLEDIENVTYTLDGDSIEAGTHELIPGTYLVTATAAAGFTFPGGATTIEFADVIVNPTPECDTEEPTPTPTPTPTEDPDPEPTPTPTEDPEPTEEPTPTPSESPSPETNNCEAYDNSGAWCDPDVNDYSCDDVPATHRPMDLIDADNDPFELDSDNDGIGCELVVNDDGDDTNEDTLPDTGSDGNLTMVLTIVAGLLIAGGVFAAVATRRRATA